MAGSIGSHVERREARSAGQRIHSAISWKVAREASAVVLACAATSLSVCDSSSQAASFAEELGSLIDAHVSAGMTDSEQDAFIMKLRHLSHDLDMLNGEARDAENAGKLPPSDLDERLEQKSREIDDVFHRSTPVANDWRAELDRLSRHGDLVVFQASYREQRYELKIFDEKAKVIAEQFTRGDEIHFSGPIGPERSITRYGAFLNPEFSFYPTRVRNQSVELTQPTEQVERLLGAEKQSTIDRSIEGQIKGLCKQVVVSNLKYPASAHFAWFQSEIIKKSSTRWHYSGVIEANNDLGGTLSIRFLCKATLKGDEWEAIVQFLE